MRGRERNAYTASWLPLHWIDARAAPALLCATPEDRQIARISCHRRHRAVERNSRELMGLFGKVP